MISIYNIQSVTSVKYLGLILDKRLTWAEHIKLKRLQLNLRQKSLYPLLGKHSKLNLKNKLLLYKTLLKPIWAYGIQLWGAAKKSNIYKMQTFQSISLRVITNASYSTYRTIHYTQILEFRLSPKWSHSPTSVSAVALRTPSESTYSCI